MLIQSYNNMPTQAFFPHSTDELEALSSYTLVRDPGSPTGSGRHLDRPGQSKDDGLDTEGHQGRKP